MDTGETAAVIIACATVAAAVIMIWAATALTRTVGELRATLGDLQRETLPVVTELRGTVVTANAELERVHELLGTAESVSATVDSASRLAHTALVNPMIKAVAFTAGTRGAARRLRRRRGEG
ncbi:hypothetical protein BH18ACT4_BH18ACT4_07520 [soil metagenome]